MTGQDSVGALDHHAHLRRAIALSVSASATGNHPFGATLVDPSGRVVLEVENTVVDDNDDTSHAELNLIRTANRKFSREERATLVLYSSAEPCAMCATAMFWSGFRALVFGISQQRLYSITTKGNAMPVVHRMQCREVFAAGANAPTNVIGPLLEDEAAIPHAGYWANMRRK